jgi:integrase/recombinase XerD
MKSMNKPNELSRTLCDFFTDYLPRLRGVSPNTILSYRDCLASLLRFVAIRLKCSVMQLDIKDLNAEKVIAFLEMLENERHNSVVTRNIRLSAIHSFFQYISIRHIEKLEHCQSVLAVPFKRTSFHPIEYLEYNEIQAILAVIDRSKEDGERDYVLIVTMFNTGARVQEILDMRVSDLQLVRPYQVRIFGKGRKERICPLWQQTAHLLKRLLAVRGCAQSDEHVFLNHQKQPLTRFGVRYLLKKYCDLAKLTMPTLVKKKLHPHSMRHSTAVHLLKSGIDIVTISHWLGHSGINTTNRYVSIDLEMKRKAIRKADSVGKNSKKAPWTSNASILTWLESL